jgi:UDP-N-acetylmuramoyl-L-alanyl-D-glutamate--2,6-diaminopimelate ligase
MGNMIALQTLWSALPDHVKNVTQADVPQRNITGITDDSRQVQPGFIFVAYRGIETDAHKYIPSAIQRGASAIVCEYHWHNDDILPAAPTLLVKNGREAFAWLCAAFHHFPSRSIVLIGVTGTDGKTTTSTLIYNILKAAGHKVGLISTVNAVIGDKTYDTGLHTTTPDADDIQNYLSQMRDVGTTHCVLEVTSHGLSHHRVDGCEFDVAVVTNITHEHLDLHGSREAYRAAKGRLFAMLADHAAHHPPAHVSKSSSKLKNKVAVLNANDTYSYEYLANVSASITQTHYIHQPSESIGDLMEHLAHSHQQVSCKLVDHSPTGMTLKILSPLGQMTVQSPFIGDFNVSNILAAVGTAMALGVPKLAMIEGVANTQSVPGRLERIVTGQPFTAIVDFAHTPNALMNVLHTLRRITQHRLIVVFGCAGERDAQKRPMMAQIAAELADIAIFTAEDPRRESLDKIMAEMMNGVPAYAQTRVLRIHDRAEAIRTACLIANEGDVVVACGKGHEQSMCFGTTEYPWDDRIAMRDALILLRGGISGEFDQWLGFVKGDRREME